MADDDDGWRGHWIDRRELPKQVYVEGYPLLDISNDDIAAEEFSGFRAIRCGHEYRTVIKRQDAAGRTFYSRFCSECGYALGNHLPRLVAVREGVSQASKDDIDRRAVDYIRRRQTMFDETVDDAADRAKVAAQASREQWREDYQDYLRTPEWRTRRAAILRRDGGVCRGCLSRPATEVHHLTYEHVRHEFAFELIAICDHCHARIHGIDGEA